MFSVLRVHVLLLDTTDENKWIVAITPQNILHNMYPLSGPIRAFEAAVPTDLVSPRCYNLKKF
jgi:hypothetical protein